jgi:hypothetical protein
MLVADVDVTLRHYFFLSAPVNYRSIKVATNLGLGFRV